MIRVFVLARIRLYREGLVDVLDRQPGFDVVGAAAGWEAAAPLVEGLRPDIVLLDMATEDSESALVGVLAASPAPPVVALAVPDADDDLLACVEAGVSGYVTRDDSLETLVAAIESVARGELLCTPRMAATLLRRVASLAAGAAPAMPAGLTRREAEILALVDEGLSNKEIARRLLIEVATVKNHVHNILEKLGVNGRAEAAAQMRARRI